MPIEKGCAVLEIDDHSLWFIDMDGWLMEVEYYFFREPDVDGSELGWYCLPVAME